jgi:hypothetical protein
MPGMRRVELALRALTVVSAAIAAAALLWPASVPRVEIAPAGLEGGSTGPLLAGADADLVGTIAQANIFSSTRSAPRVRYRPLGSGVEGESPRDDAGAGAREGGVPQLYGIVPGAAGAAALLRLDPAASGALLYREGDRGGRYRVDQIGEQSVVLTGPAGRLELRLPRPPESSR